MVGGIFPELFGILSDTTHLYKFCARRGLGMDGGVIVLVPAWRLFKCWEVLIGLVLKLHSKSRSYISNLLSNLLQVNHSLNSELIGDTRQVLSRRIRLLYERGCGKLLLIRVSFIDFTSNGGSGPALGSGIDAVSFWRLSRPTSGNSSLSIAMLLLSFCFCCPCCPCCPRCPRCQPCPCRL